MQQLVGDRSPATASVLLPILKKRKKKKKEMDDASSTLEKKRQIRCWYGALDPIVSRLFNSSWTCILGLFLIFTLILIYLF
jgi:hypothetical protein